MVTCFMSEGVDSKCLLTGLVRVAQYGFLLGPQARAGPVFHPRGHGELVRQVLGDQVVGDVGGLAPVEPVDEVAVSAAVGEEGRRPVCGRAGRGEEVSAARRRACPVSETRHRQGQTLSFKKHPTCLMTKPICPHLM